MDINRLFTFLCWVWLFFLLSFFFCWVNVLFLFFSSDLRLLFFSFGYGFKSMNYIFFSS